MIYLLNEPLLFLVSLLLAASVTVAATLVILLFRRGESRRRASLLPPPFITAVVFPAAIVMGLLVNDSWKRFIEAQDVVQQEAALLQLIHSHKGQLAEPFRAEVKAVIDRYAQLQIPEDWRLLRRGERPPADNVLLPLLRQFDLWLTDDENIAEAQLAQLGRLSDEVMELAKLRGQRILLSEGRMDWPKWLVVFCLLFTCTLILSEITLHMRPAYLASMALFVLGNGAVLYLLLTHERPFAGGAAVKPPELMQTVPTPGGAAAPGLVPAAR